MLLVGLTGSIGMGKTETAKMFARLGVPVYDADAAVHALYAPGGAAVGPIGEAFPDAIRDGAVDRTRLGAAVVGKPEEMQRLEAIIHPLVRQAQIEWLEAREKEGAPLAVLDIPLLFETGGDALMDVIVVVSAPEEVQRERVLARPGMTEEKFEAILARQTPDAEKRARADYVVETHRGLDDAFEQVKGIVHELKRRAGKGGAE
ncbi:MAG: dephospho-CoA kinase [Alphaproteobacteria bacterium]